MNVEPIDTAFLVRSLQEQVLQYTWRHTLDRVQIDFLMLFCLLLMVILVLVYFYMKRRIRRAVQVERRQRIFQEAHYRNMRLYEEQQMRQQLEEAVAQAQQPSKDKVAQLAESGIFRLFHRARMEEVRVTEEDWKALQDAINEAYPDFVARLYALVPKLSTIELQISLLIKINVSVTDIAYHVSRTKQAVAVSRARLYKKITGNDGSAELFDKYILEM